MPSLQEALAPCTVGLGVWGLGVSGFGLRVSGLFRVSGFRNHLEFGADGSFSGLGLRFPDPGA